MKTKTHKENLTISKKNKNDEFYTQLTDIEKELKHYKEYFRNKIVYCNCDDPYESNFFKFFALSFYDYGLKKLIATCYVDSPIANTELSLFDDESAENKTTRVPHKIEITEIPDMNNDGAVDLTDVQLLLASDRNHLTRLKGDGDFRSEECVELLKEADIVVTNPPFSLFREYVAQLVKYDKKFLIIGNVNALAYKEIFPLIRTNKIWLGPSISSGDREFKVPAHYPLEAAGQRVDEKGNKYIRVKGVRWYTNLDHIKRHEDLILYKKYNEKEFSKYDNHNAINIDKTADIPEDYDGVIGVPITFLDKFNPEQFEIVSPINCKEDAPVFTPTNPYYTRVNGEAKYARILIKNKNPKIKEEYNKRLDIKFSKNNN